MICTVTLISAGVTPKIPTAGRSLRDVYYNTMADSTQYPLAPGLPSPERNQADATGLVSSDSRAVEIRDFHQRGLRASKRINLTAEKYLLHVDGEGGAQWLDLFHGQRLKIPAPLSGAPRVQNNQLRPILDNYVSHLTTQPFRFVVESRQDRSSRESAILDQAIVNHQVRVQTWNSLWAEAKYMAACAGFCPVHAAWRDDMSGDPYEAVLAQDGVGNPMTGPRPGSIDSWVGNPFDHVFDSGSRRGSLHRQTYGRVLPAQMVRAAFGNDSIEGNDRMPSSSTFQRVAQKWTSASGMVHGSSQMSAGWGHDELVGLIYDEIAPGIDPQYPDGCLHIVALQGLSSTNRDEARGGVGTPMLLWSGPLPAKAFSSVNVYGHQRADDPRGKPFISDLDDDQIQLNQLESLVNEYLRRASKPPLASSGRVNVETLNYKGDTVLEVEPLGPGSVELSYLEYPGRHISLLQNKIARVLDGMYRKGGWQASSRGEAGGESGKAIIALQQADDSIFGPATHQTRMELESYARLNWRLFKTFGDVPAVLDVVGDELAHLTEAHIDRSMLSETPPVFTLVSGFGTSTEAKAQQLLNLFSMTDQRGEQVINTRQLKKLWPDPSLFREVDDPQDVRERRPRVVNASIRKAAKVVREMYPELPFALNDPMLQEMAQMVAFEIDGMHPSLMDDDLEHHINILSGITQEETEDPLVRQVARIRQQQYWKWLADKMQNQQQQQDPEQKQQATAQPQKPQFTPSTQEAFNPASAAGINAQSMVQADNAFTKRTA